MIKRPQVESEEIPYKEAEECYMYDPSLWMTFYLLHIQVCFW